MADKYFHYFVTLRIGIWCYYYKLFTVQSREIMYLVASVCLFVHALTAEPFDLDIYPLRAIM